MKNVERAGVRYGVMTEGWKTFHDFRRTAVRRLEWAGGTRSVAMQLTGHKTEAMYNRHAASMKRPADLRRGVAMVAERLRPANGSQSSQ